MAEKYHGRRRAPGRYNPLSELALAVSRASAPAIKGTAVLAASGGLVAAFAIPASAVGDRNADPVVAFGQGSPAMTSIGDRAAEVAASRTAARPALTAPTATPAAPQTFGAMTVTAVEKPPPPPPPPPVQVQQVTSSSGNSAARSSTGSRSASSSSSSSSSASTQQAAPAAPQRAATGGVLGVAASLTGIPYRWGGTTPAGFDCSGFTQYVFNQVGVSLGRTTYAQYAQTRAVSNPQPGDLVFFGGSSPYHVGIYAGNGMMYDSPRAGKSTSLRPVFSDSGISYRRV